MSITETMAFSGTALVASIGLFVFSIWMSASAKTHTARKTVKLKKLTKQLESDITEIGTRLGEVEAELKKLEAEEKALGIEVMQVRKSCGAAAMETFEIVHEIGSPASGGVRYDVEVLLSKEALMEGTAGVQTEPRLWERRNVAHVWSNSPQDALQAAGRAFPARYGYVITKFLNANVGVGDGA